MPLLNYSKLGRSFLKIFAVEILLLVIVYGLLYLL